MIYLKIKTYYTIKTEILKPGGLGRLFEGDFLVSFLNFRVNSVFKLPSPFIYEDLTSNILSLGRVQTALGVWVPFVITDFNDGLYWSWKVSGIHATGHRVEQVDYKKCRLIFEVPWFAAPYVTVCKIAAERIEKLLKRA